MTFLFVLLFILLINGTYVYLFKKSFGKTLPISLFISTIIMYITGLLFKSFKIGLYINLGLSLLPILFIVINFKNSNKLKEYKDNYFSNAFYAFIIVFFMIFIFDFKRKITMWDERSHWGVMLKEMLRLDDFYTVNNSTLLFHKDYPPMIQLFELLCLLVAGKFKESIAISSIHLLGISLFLPIIDNLKTDKKKTIISSIILPIILFLSILFIDKHHVINSIYIDYVMSLVIGYLLLDIFNNEDLKSIKTIVFLSISFLFLILIKQIAICFYLMVLFYYVINLIYKKVRVNIKDIILFIILLIVVPLIGYKSWSSYISHFELEKQFDISNISVSEVSSIYKEKDDSDYRYVASTNFFKKLYKENISNSYIPLSFIVLFILLIIVLFIIYKIGVIKKKELLLIYLTMILGCIGYIIVMNLSYMFLFSKEEALEVASFDRYMSSFVIMYSSFIISLVFKYIINNKKNIMLISLVIFMIIIQSPKMIVNYSRPALRNNYVSKYEEDGKLIISKIGEGVNKVFIVSEDNGGDFASYPYAIKYYANPIIVNRYNFDLTSEQVKNNINNILDDYDYVFLANINEDFGERYKDLFTSEIIVDSVYKVNHGEVISLSLVQ